MAGQIITITPIGDVSIYILEHIGESLKRTFKVDVEYFSLPNIVSCLIELLYGEKYHSTLVLKYLSDRVPDKSLKLLAVTELDLYSPIFSCLYGEAQLGGACALVSLHRFRQEYYNLNRDEDVFLSRCEKSVIHEIAHTFGLMHCCDNNCVMYPSNNIIDTDIKSNSFCSKCMELLRPQIIEED